MNVGVLTDGTTEAVRSQSAGVNDADDLNTGLTMDFQAVTWLEPLTVVGARLVEDVQRRKSCSLTCQEEIRGAREETGRSLSKEDVSRRVLKGYGKKKTLSIPVVCFESTGEEGTVRPLIGCIM